MRIGRSVVLSSVLLLGALPASAATVAVFDNPAYVDTGGAGEATSVKATLASLGHVVVPFSATDSAGVTAALVGVDLVLIPELEIAAGDLAADLDSQTRTLFANFVAGGRGMIVHGTTDQKAAELLNALFGFSLTTGSVGPADITAEVAGTSFAGGPAQLPDNLRTRGVDQATLPGDSSVFYLNGSRAVVGRMPHRSGRVLFLGWDWFDAQPNGSEDGGWLSTLDSAVTDITSCLGPGPDADGDGIIDECDAPDQCADVDGQREFALGSKVSAKRVGPGSAAGDDRLRVKGEFILPPGFIFADIDPMAQPVVLVVRVEDGSDRISQSFPLTEFEGGASVGWTLARSGNSWKFRDAAEATNGIRRASIKDRDHKDPGRVRIDIQGRKGDYPLLPGDEPLTALVIVGDPNAGMCAQTDYGEFDCRFNGRNTAVSCRR